MILVFGSLNMDLLFRVKQLPAPGETVLCPAYIAQHGGKGMNQAIAAARAGASVAMAGCVGRDAFGVSALATLANEQIDAGLIRRVAEPTGCASISIDDSGENSIVVASGANLAPTADQVPDERLTPDTLVVMQMEVTVGENWRLMARAKARGARTLLNVAPFAPVPAEALRHADVLVLNEIEAAQLAGTEAGFDTVARDIARRSGGTCVITLGSQGSLAATGDEVIATPVLPIQPVDTTGAGDAFVGVLAAALDAGHALKPALARASVGGALACLAVGAQAALPRAADIEARLGELS